MSYVKLKAIYGSLSPKKISEIREISPAAAKLLDAFPVLLEVAGAAIEFDVTPRPEHRDELTKAIDALEED